MGINFTNKVDDTSHKHTAPLISYTNYTLSECVHTIRVSTVKFWFWPMPLYMKIIHHLLFIIHWLTIIDILMDIILTLLYKVFLIFLSSFTLPTLYGFYASLFFAAVNKCNFSELNNYFVKSTQKTLLIPLMTNVAVVLEKKQQNIFNLNVH